MLKFKKNTLRVCNILWALGFISLLGLISCGVKGDPEPPFPPQEMGRGRPTFSGATKDVSLKKQPAYKTEDDEDWPDEPSEGVSEADAKRRKAPARKKK